MFTRLTRYVLHDQKVVCLWCHRLKVIFPGGGNVYATLVRVVAERGPARVNSIYKRHDPKSSDRA